MASDLEALEDILFKPDTTEVKNYGKFRPKAKPGSKNVTLTLPTPVPSDSDGIHLASLNVSPLSSPMIISCSNAAAHFYSMPEAANSGHSKDGMYLETPLSSGHKDAQEGGELVEETSSVFACSGDADDTFQSDSFIANSEDGTLTHSDILVKHAGSSAVSSCVAPRNSSFSDGSQYHDLQPSDQNGDFCTDQEGEEAAVYTDVENFNSNLPESEILSRKKKVQFEVLQNEDGKSSDEVSETPAVGDPTVEIEDGHNDDEMPAYILEEDYLADWRMGQEGTSSRNIASEKAKNSFVTNEKHFQRDKKASDTCDSKIKIDSKKRFCHSSRRKRTLVNKALLETPEDEIDPTKLILKDLILLAEFKERKIMKAAAALKGSASHPRVEPAKSKLNYHTFMVKTPREKWSKVDTLTFYEGLRQFGTNFAMIQQLFPGRSRNQIKLKFKAEERKHPLEISDALICRTRDHSHFELVIQRLQAQAEQNRVSQSPASKGEHLECEMREDSEVMEAAKAESEATASVHEEATENWEDDTRDVEEVDEAYDWSSYRSDAYDFDGADYT